MALADGTLGIDVYARGANLHVGEILQPVSKQEFLVTDYLTFGPERIGGYAVRAVEAAPQA